MSEHRNDVNLEYADEHGFKPSMTRPDLAELQGKILELAAELGAKQVADSAAMLELWLHDKGTRLYAIAAALRKIEQDSAATGAQDVAAWQVRRIGGCGTWSGAVHTGNEYPKNPGDLEYRPLYTAPAPRGVTDDMVERYLIAEEEFTQRLIARGMAASPDVVCEYALEAALSASTGEQPKLICPLCEADRFVEPCRKPHAINECPMIGKAQGEHREGKG